MKFANLIDLLNFNQFSIVSEFYNKIIERMVSGGIKVTVRTGRIVKQDLAPRISPFIRIKAGNRLADSKKLNVDSLKNDLSWNQSLSLIFRNQSHLHIYLLDSDRNIAHFQNQIGVCILNLQMLATNQKQQIFGVFHNSDKLAALIQLQVEYETILEEKIEAALTQLSNKQIIQEIVYHRQPEQRVYQSLKLKLKIIEANITHNTEAMGKMSPYCRLQIKQTGKQFQTTVMKGDHPKFNEVFIMENITETMTLSLELWDKQTIKDDDFIGGTTISFKNLIVQQPTLKEVEIKYQNSKKAFVTAGTVKIQFNVC